ncbi:MAG: hypothetical protein M3R65_06655 [Gemmatimonadota bacterium]|nr:hypothetical protein [Gemmatimonadota bacterium]
MPPRRSRVAIVALWTALCPAVWATSARAQAVTGLGDDATLTPAGSVRIKIQSDWSYYDQLFVSPAPGAAGVLRPLGGRFTLDSLGVAQLPILRPFQDSLRAITGIAGLNVSLGQTAAQVTNRITSVPISFEVGVARWLSITALVPIVHTRTSVFFRANQATNLANLAANPAGTDPTARATDSILTQQMVSSAAAVRSYCSGAGSADPQCAGSAPLVASATGLGNSLSNLYTYGLLVPTRGSGIQAAVDARIANVRGALNAFAANPASGVPLVTATGVVSAPVPLATPALQALLTNSPYGVGLDPLQTVERTHVGDAELTAKVMLFDSFRVRNESRFAPTGVNVRLSAAAGYRFPTGALPSANALTDIGSGTHIGAVLLRGYADISLGKHFWLSGIARFAKVSSDSISIRLAPGVAFPSASSVVGLTRQTGNLLELDALPRWVFNDFVSVGGEYLYRHKPADAYTSGGVAVPELELGSDFTEQRVGGGIVFSNAHAVSQGKSNIPFDVSYLHTETITGTGGAVPKIVNEQILIRLYFRLRRER